MSILTTWTTPSAPIVTRHALRTHRRTLAAWSIGLATLIGVYAAFWPSLRGNTSWRQVFDTMPKSYKALFTVGGQIDLTTPAGYLGVELLSFMGPTLIAAYAISVGVAGIAGEEQHGTLEIVMSAPIARGRVLGERLAALAAGLAVLAVVQGAALQFFSAVLGMGLSPVRILGSSVALAAFGLFTGSVGLAVGALSGRATLARAVAALAGIAAYLVNALAQITSALRPARPVSPFYLLLGNNPLAHGLRWGPAVAVVVVSVVLVALAAIGLERRDLT